MNLNDRGQPTGIDLHASVDDISDNVTEITLRAKIKMNVIVGRGEEERGCLRVTL